MTTGKEKYRISVVVSELLLLGILLFAEDARIRIFVTDSHSWEVSGGVVGIDGTVGGGTSGGARPQTAEIMKTFAERCPSCTVTIKKENADYIVLLDHEGGKAVFLRDNKIAVFNNKSGDMIYSGSTRSLGNAITDACGAIAKDHGSNP